MHPLVESAKRVSVVSIDLPEFEPGKVFVKKLMVEDWDPFEDLITIITSGSRQVVMSAAAAALTLCDETGALIFQSAREAAATLSVTSAAKALKAALDLNPIEVKDEAEVNPGGDT